MTQIEKANVCKVKYRADDAARGSQALLDSKIVEEILTEKELAALETCADFLTKVRDKINKVYDDQKAWENA